MDRLMLGLSTTAVGMLVVFVGLIILIACIYVMTSFTGRGARKGAQAPKREAPPAPAPAPEAEFDMPDAENDLQVIAAITAAITMIWQSEKNESGFVVRRIRRAQSASARALAAREEQMYSRL